MASLSPLITADELEDRLGNESIRIADCRFYLAEPNRGESEYNRAHIPGARYFSLDDHLTGSTGPGRHPLPDPSSFTKFIGSVGIGDEHEVIVYDDGPGGIAARMWWMLQSLGHDRVRVLDGGWNTWNNDTRAATSTIPQWDPAVFTGAGHWSGVIDADEIDTHSTDLLLIDARAPERFRGDAEPIDPIAGHIPGAVNLPYGDNTDPEGRFWPEQHFNRRFAEVLSSKKRLVSYCGSGVTACNNLLALAVAGHTDALLYPGSWSDWCTSGRAVARQSRSKQP